MPRLGNDHAATQRTDHFGVDQGEQPETLRRYAVSILPLVRQTATDQRRRYTNMSRKPRYAPAVPSKRWPLLTEQQAIANIVEHITINESGCWLWQRGKNTCGYGEIVVRNKRWMVHRYIYTVFIGEIPKGMHVCHYCDQPNCINPSHLWIGTHKQNMADCRAKGRYYYANLTHCKHGHEFNAENTQYRKPGHLRACKACQRAHQRIRQGWPEELAYSLPAVAHGYKRPSVSTDSNVSGSRT